MSEPVPERPTPERRRELLREMTQQAVEAGMYGEPAPEMRPTPPDDTAQPGRRYRLSLEFGAADDSQAQRLGMAWAGTAEAEWNTCNPVVTPVGEGDTEGLRERVEAAWNASEDSCARCQHCDRQVNAVLAVLVEPPGDLLEATAALFRHAPGEPRLGDETPGEIARAVLSVRWEDAARRIAAAEARAERSRERYGIAFQRALNEGTRADRAEAQVAALQRELAQAHEAIERALEFPHTNRTVRMLRAALPSRPDVPEEIRRQAQATTESTESTEETNDV